ncbi:DegV family protein [Enterococcus asini]|uniref:DegV family protein n=1 Tax=Enterococcus asini TaxID=57732 RepID=UPI00288EBBEC|nr:DegV family protein [Enterococcus asini]MDT2756033.1 DegV family protein [Enterococcus asini]
MNKEKIAILADSGSDVPQDFSQAHHVYTLPLKVIYPDREYTDKVDISSQEVIDRMPGEIPKTSLPDGASIVAVFDEIKAAGYEKVIAVTISSGLSGTYNMVQMMAKDYEGLDIFVLDTKNIGIASGLQAIRAVELVESGLDFETICQKLAAEVFQNKVFFNVATLEYLQKGGRIGLVTAIFGTALKLNPIISCNEEGVYYTVAKSRGRKKSLAKSLELVKDFAGKSQKYRLAVAHAGAKEEAQEMMKWLTALLPNAVEQYFGEISPALVVHTGPGLLGVGVQVLD